MNILLGLTGSVATTLAPKIIEALESIPNTTEVRVVMTEKAQMFQPPAMLSFKSKVKVYCDHDEWKWERKSEHQHFNCPQFDSEWKKNDPILHIDLARWASIIVIAPCTANTLFKIAHGQTDDLLSSIVSARNPMTPMVIAPAMNTLMWSNPPNKRNVAMVNELTSVTIVNPVDKILACGEKGIGALADIKTITETIREITRWSFPMPTKYCNGIPVGNHPGAFGAIRKYERHCGVDLYCEEGTPVLAVEQGEIVAIENFTGSKANCPWWLDTEAIKIEGAHYTICYGELIPDNDMFVGKKIFKGERIGTITPVIKPERARPDIPGHSRSMLHFQLYPKGVSHKDEDWAKESTTQPKNVIDPTPMILDSLGCPTIQLEIP